LGATPPACRRLTLSGTGGVGKIRLAQQLGAKLLGHHPHGVWLAERLSLRSAKG
jgi:predicted ATPase